MAPTVTPPPFPGPLGSGRHPVLVAPSGKFPALRPNGGFGAAPDSSGLSSGAYRALVGPSTVTVGEVYVEQRFPPATASDVSAALTGGRDAADFRQGHAYDDRLFALAERVAGTMVGAPVNQVCEKAADLVKRVLDAGSYIPDGAHRTLLQVTDRLVAEHQGRQSVSAVERFCNAVSVVLKSYS